MIHPDSEIVTVDATIGVGVCATRSIPRGTIVWALDRFDIVIDGNQFQTLGAQHQAILQRWGYRDHFGRWILCWDGGRMVNHRCEPSMRGVGPDLMIAVRDLAIGDELTCDYAECNLAPPLECRCGAEACRGQVGGADLLTFHEAWDAEVRSAIADSLHVPQPLWPVLLDPEGLRKILENPQALPSLRDVYLAPDSPFLTSVDEASRPQASR